MVQYILRRLLFLPFIMILVSAILFAFVVQVPAEARVMIYMPTTSGSISEEEYARLKQITIERYGLDKPFYVQYFRWISNLLQGDWGYSPIWKQPVMEGLLQRAPATIELGLFALVPATLLALLSGQLAARYKNHIWDYCIRGAAFLGWAFPPFILGSVFDECYVRPLALVPTGAS